MSAFLWYHPGKPPFHEGSEEKHMAKAQWTTPQLIVLARGTPEERVLESCKNITPVIAGADEITQDGCNRLAAANCGACQGRGGS